ncbi:alpha/beta hydrolase [Lachnospira pectinoschiza]|uniref:Acetyl esterase/lipase n=1 Tax=Lachnospira pectinoschiza TaxID=28052 RepID=A0A1G9TMK1_9FIRM|nr:alpha/beta hydrolase [Lachnospira pectinoschiza]SDM48911.1 Acetyl esterase/lipase [Lachnospira pectinoschiza]
MMKQKGKKTGMYVLLCIVVFVVSFAGSALFKFTHKSAATRKYMADWNDEVGTVYTDIEYGTKEANKFDLYVPADVSKDTYNLVVYIHAGGFTTGDKSDDKEMLQWLCSKGYVAAGINYTLRDDEHPDANIYTQSMEIKEAMPYVVNAAKEKGYNIDAMAMSGGSAGGCLAMLYAYRDASESPVPVKMLFEAVGPSSFYPEDWKCYGLDLPDHKENAAGLFSVMSGKNITADMFGTVEYDEVMKDISALLWVDKNTVPSILAYGKHDKGQPYESSIRLDQRLTDCGVKHEYIVFEHSGHGLQNDSKKYIEYMEKVEEYLATYLPVE